MNNNIIITTPDELKGIICEVIANALSKDQHRPELPDSINLSSAVELLAEYGFPTSKAKIYKLTSANSMPYRKYGNKLVFSRKTLIEWAHQQLIDGELEKGKSAISIERCFNRKR